jgi:hypothetical protein
MSVSLIRSCLFLYHLKDDDWAGFISLTEIGVSFDENNKANFDLMENTLLGGIVCSLENRY